MARETDDLERACRMADGEFVDPGATRSDVCVLPNGTRVEDQLANIKIEDDDIDGSIKRDHDSQAYKVAAGNTFWVRGDRYDEIKINLFDA